MCGQWLPSKSLWLPTSLSNMAMDLKHNVGRRGFHRMRRGSSCDLLHVFAESPSWYFESVFVSRLAVSSTTVVQRLRSRGSSFEVAFFLFHPPSRGTDARNERPGRRVGLVDRCREPQAAILPRCRPREQIAILHMRIGGRPRSAQEGGHESTGVPEGSAETVSLRWCRAPDRLRGKGTVGRDPFPSH